MVVDAVTIIKQSDGRGGFKYPVKAIRVLKANGKSMRESMLINGFALNCVIAMQGKEIISFLLCKISKMIKNYGQLMQLANDCDSVIHVYENKLIST